MTHIAKDMNNDVQAIPMRMARLPRDKRGLPVPWIVMRDDKGDAHFAVNDAMLMLRCITERLCGICGDHIGHKFWGVGGPRSAFSPDGAYHDPPMHRACLHYALKVCPYMARKNWKDLDVEKVIQNAERNMKIAKPQKVESTHPGQPDVFVAFSCESITVVGLNPLLWVPQRPLRTVEYWKGGVQLSEAAGRALLPDECKSTKGRD